MYRSGGLLLFFFICHLLIGQIDSTSLEPTVIDLQEIENNNKRDEIQRYTGYEDLLFRYLTLPYDLSTNTNGQGRFVDFGFAIIALLPIVMISLLYKRRKLFYAFIALFALYLCLCLSYSFFHVQDLGVVRNHAEFFDEFVQSGNGGIGQTIMKYAFEVTYPIARLVRKFGKMITGESDHLTYPLLIVFFLLSLLLFNMQRVNQKGLFLYNIFISFAFLWLLLSGGILWYGFLLIPLSYLVILYFNANRNFTNRRIYRFTNVLCVASLVVALCLGYVGRISNITNVNLDSAKDGGKKILEGNIFQYTTGMIGEQQALNNSYANIGNALEIVNSDEALIYQVGTFFAFDIKKNTKRLYNDQTLGGFYRLVQEIRDKNEIIRVLKKEGFRYILVDLYTHTLDRTPEKSLTKKYQLFLNTIYQNSSLQLLATDRIIESEMDDGSLVRESRVFGKNIISYGSYAIYRIL